MSSQLLTTSFAAVINTGEQVAQNTVSAPFTFVDNAAPAPIGYGSGAGLAQHTWTNTFTVNTSGTSFNLQALAGGLDGGTRNFSKIKSIKITNKDTTNVVNVGNAASNPWTGLCSVGTALMPIGPGGHLWNHSPSAAGLPMSGTSLNLLIAAAAATCSVTVTIVGEGT